MKVFKMNDCDWWMDTDLETAKKNYLGFVETEPESVEDAREMTDDELDNTRFINRDEEFNRLFPKYTFRDHVDSIEHTSHFFASTES